jgi:hypothetical protein
LLQGLRGNTESVDSEGNVTPQSLGKYVYKAIMSLPADKRPKQMPITRAEESGDVILASHPELKPDTNKGLIPAVSPTAGRSSGGGRKYQFLVRNRYRLLVPIVGSNTGGDTSASLRPVFSLLLNRRQHQYLAKDDGNLGQTLQITGFDDENNNNNNNRYSYDVILFHYCLCVVR